jgi:magnesium-transporting ATPase (P-type)
MQVAKASADVVIMDDNFDTIVNVARWGRAVYLNIQKFVQFQLTVNIVALIVNFISACIIGILPVYLLIIISSLLHPFKMISYTVLCEPTCRQCTTYCRPVALGEHDHGHAGSPGISHRAT